MKAMALGLWTGVLIALILGPLCWPLEAHTFSSAVFFGLRDMVVTPHPLLGDNAFGLGDLPARNAPQDAVLALAGLLFPATWLVRVIMLCAALTAALGAALWARGNSWAQFGAITVVLWNPFIAERLLQGHWSLVAATWCLPLLTWCAHKGQLLGLVLCIWLASLTPTGAVAATLVGVLSSRTWRRAGLSLGLGVLMSLPWLVPSLLNMKELPHFTTTMLQAFAPNAEAYVGTVGALLGLGGIWNAAVVPPSRQQGFGILGLLLVALVLVAVMRTKVRVPWPLVVAGVVGFSWPLLVIVAPEAARAVMLNIPGALLLRDAQKTLMLVFPLMVCVVGAVIAKARSPKLMAVAVVLLAIGQVPDIALQTRHLAPIDYPAELQARRSVDFGGDLLFPQASSIVEYQGRHMVDPRTKDLPMVVVGSLVVDAQEVDPPNPRFTQAVAAWEAGDKQQLADLGIAAVIDGDNTFIIPGAETQGRPKVSRLGLGLTLSWVLIPLLLCLWLLIRPAGGARLKAR